MAPAGVERLPADGGRLLLLSLMLHVAHGGGGKTIWTSVQWRSFQGVDSQASLLSGIFSVLFEWEHAESENADVDLRDYVVLPNFMEGNGGRVKLADMKYTPSWPHPLGTTHVMQHRASIDYIGSFSQSASGSCYPWDKPTMEIKLSLPHVAQEGDMAFGLFCQKFRSECQAFSADGDELDTTDPLHTFRYRPGEVDACGDQYDCKAAKKIVDAQWEGVRAKKFDWSAMTCALSDDAMEILCTFTGERAWRRTFMMDLLPGSLMSLIGFGSFLLPVEKSMPRIATTMIALLSFVTKSIHVLSSLPPHHISWMEEFYLAGVFAMFLNMMGHFISFSRSPAVAYLVDCFQLYIFFPSFLFVLMTMLLLKVLEDCDGINKGTAVFLFILSLLVAIAGVVTMFFKVKMKFKEVSCLVASLSPVLPADTCGAHDDDDDG